MAHIFQTQVHHAQEWTNTSPNQPSLLGEQ
jgi:hypothetical protein